MVHRVSAKPPTIFWMPIPVTHQSYRCSTARIGNPTSPTRVYEPPSRSVNLAKDGSKHGIRDGRLLIVKVRGVIRIDQSDLSSYIDRSKVTRDQPCASTAGVKSGRSDLRPTAGTTSVCVMLMSIVKMSQKVKAVGMKAGLAVATINRQVAVPHRVANLAHFWGCSSGREISRMRSLAGSTPAPCTIFHCELPALIPDDHF